MTKKDRGGRIYLDYLRNDRMATAVAVPRPPVAKPLPVGYAFFSLISARRNVAEKAADRETDKVTEPDPTCVFIVFGRNSKAYNAMMLFVQSLGLSPLTFDEARNDVKGSPYLGKIIAAAMREAQAVVVLLTPDEYAALRPSLAGAHDKPDDLARWQPRPNVLFEAGMALMNDEKRTILTVVGDLPIASDMHGRHFLRIGNDANSRAKLKDALSATGCKINEKVTSWQDIDIAGDFETCISSLPEVSAASPFAASAAAKGGISVEDLPIRATTVDRATNPGIVYKAKLTVIFTNRSGQTIHVSRPRWITAFDEIGIQSPLRYAYRLEAALDTWERDRWQDEFPDLEIAPGWSFAIWIGLDPSVPQNDLEGRRRSQRLGSLLIPVGAGGENNELLYRV